MSKFLPRLSGRVRALLRKFGVALWLIVITTWHETRRLPIYLKRGVRSDYLLPALMIGYFVVEAGAAAIGRNVSWITFAVVCFMGVLAQLTVISGKRSIAAQKAMRKSDEIFWMAEKQELVNKVVEYKEGHEQMRVLFASVSKQLEHADRRYDELLHVQTEDIIAEVNRRLSDNPPVQHVFPDVPAAPKAPPELNPNPPF